MSTTNTPEETVTIKKAEYESLLKDSLRLEALRQGGVDNWEWYDEHFEPYREMLKEYGLSDD